MNKHNVISDAIATIPDWLAFLQVKEDEQTAILAEIQQQETETTILQSPEEVDPLSWLDEDTPPPVGEPQAPVTISDETPVSEEDDDDENESSPPWSKSE